MFSCGINLDQIRKVEWIDDNSTNHEGKEDNDTVKVTWHNGDIEVLHRQQARAVSDAARGDKPEYWIVPSIAGYEIVEVAKVDFQVRREPVIAWEVHLVDLILQRVSALTAIGLTRNTNDYDWQAQPHHWVAIQSPDGRIFSRWDCKVLFDNLAHWIAYLRMQAKRG